MALLLVKGEVSVKTAFTLNVLMTVLEFRRSKEPRTPKVRRAARSAAPALTPPPHVTKTPPTARYIASFLFPVKLLQKIKTLIPETCIQSIWCKKRENIADCRRIIMTSVDFILSKFNLKSK